MAATSSRTRRSRYESPEDMDEAIQRRLLDEEKDRELANITDPRERKRIQNKIAQRLYRQKQKRRLQALEEQLDRDAEGHSPSPREAFPFPVELPDIDTSALQHSDFAAEAPETWSNLAIMYPLSSSLHRPLSRSSTAFSHASSSPAPTSPDDDYYANAYALAGTAAGTTTRGKAKVLRTGEGAAADALLDGGAESPPRQLWTGLLRAVGFIRSSASIPLDITAFLTLSILPIRHATVMNLGRLGISLAQYRPDDAPSPFMTRRFLDISEHPLPEGEMLALVHARAPDLAPTPLQLAVPHHPYVDVLPLRGFRDNILRVLADAPGVLNETDLCDDIDRCLRVWGKAPWEARALEWTQDFVDAWAWLLDQESIDSSNFWRLQRGEERLRWNPRR